MSGSVSHAKPATESSPRRPRMDMWKRTAHSAVLGMKPWALGSGQGAMRFETTPQRGAFISLTVYESRLTVVTIATWPSALYRPPGRYTATAPTDGVALIGTPCACALISQSLASPPQLTGWLYAAHQVHWPNGKRSG